MPVGVLVAALAGPLVGLALLVLTVVCVWGYIRFAMSAMGGTMPHLDLAECIAKAVTDLPYHLSALEAQLLVALRTTTRRSGAPTRLARLKTRPHLAQHPEASGNSTDQAIAGLLEALLEAGERSIQA